LAKIQNKWVIVKDIGVFLGQTHETAFDGVKFYSIHSINTNNRLKPYSHLISKNKTTSVAKYTPPKPTLLPYSTHHFE